MRTQSDDTKQERVEVRVSRATKALLHQAARARHTTLSDFILSSAVRAAEDAVAMPKVFVASEKGWEMLQRLLDSPPEPDPAVVARLRRAARR